MRLLKLAPARLANKLRMSHRLGADAGRSSGHPLEVVNALDETLGVRVNAGANRFLG
ncbi:MAG: hypothetical protein JST54_01995 [Deltaproteobacteria bacterium]|nr:hypothetical protein [Deltaproteobacteria bacterium]